MKIFKVKVEWEAGKEVLEQEDPEDAGQWEIPPKRFVRRNSDGEVVEETEDIKMVRVGYATVIADDLDDMMELLEFHWGDLNPEVQILREEEIVENMKAVIFEQRNI